MALFDKGAISYEIEREGEDVVLRIDYENSTFVPSLEDSEACMADTVEKLIQNPNITKISFRILTIVDAGERGHRGRPRSGYHVIVTGVTISSPHSRHH